MMPRMEWAELGSDGRAVRIFKNRRAAVDCGVPLGGAFVLRAVAVDDIRRAIWERAKRRCEHCAAPLTYGTMEMHEALWRGRGGDISLENGRCLCNDCHQNDKVAGHGSRRPQWS